MDRDLDRAFSIEMLKRIKPAVRRAGKSVHRDAWVWHAGRDVWEFHGPDKFYWHGRANNAYDARYKGWTSWLEQRERRRVAEELLLRYAPQTSRGLAWLERQRAALAEMETEK